MGQILYIKKHSYLNLSTKIYCLSSHNHLIFNQFYFTKDLSDAT
jgi:hypothetical protein